MNIVIRPVISLRIVFGVARRDPTVPLDYVSFVINLLNVMYIYATNDDKHYRLNQTQSEYKDRLNQTELISYVPFGKIRNSWKIN